MKKIKNFITRYRVFLILLVINIILFFVNRELGVSSFLKTKSSLIEMLKVVPPIFILLGLMDVWVERETLMKLMGKGSGFVGMLVSFLLGSVAAGPLYAAFPIAGILLKKGAKLSNIFIFIGAWSTTKIPLLLFEASSLGLKFTLVRLSLNIIGIGMIAFFSEKLLKSKDIKEIYELNNSDFK